MELMGSGACVGPGKLRSHSDHQEGLTLNISDSKQLMVGRHVLRQDFSLKRSVFPLTQPVCLHLG